MPRDANGRFPKGSGIPAGGPAGGPGWGGDAKGPGMGKAGDLDPRARNSAAIAAKKDRAARLIEHLEHLAFNAEHEMTQVHATKAALDRHLGSPVAKQVNVDANAFDCLSDDELAAALVEIRAAIAADSAGDGAGDHEAGGAEPAGGISPVH